MKKKTMYLGFRIQKIWQLFKGFTYLIRIYYLPNFWQCPHHGAKNLTNVNPLLISWSNSSLEVTILDILGSGLGLFLLTKSCISTNVLKLFKDFFKPQLTKYAQLGILFLKQPHCRMRDKSSMFLSAIFKNVIFLCSF